MKGMLFVCLLPEDCPYPAAKALGEICVLVAAFNETSQNKTVRPKLQFDVLLTDLRAPLDRGGFTAERDLLPDGTTCLIIRNPRNYDEAVLMTIRGYKLLPDEMEDYDQRQTPKEG